MSRRTVLLLAVFLARFPAGAANDGPMERATLHGLQSVNVVIDTLDPELLRNGIDPDALRARIADGLKSAHVTLDPNAREFLGLRINQVRDRRGPFALCFSLGVYQPVVLTRDKDVHTVTQTWEVVSVVLSDPKTLNDAALDTAGDLAQRFLTAWKSVQ